MQQPEPLNDEQIINQIALFMRRANYTGDEVTQGIPNQCFAWLQRQLQAVTENDNAKNPRKKTATSKKAQSRKKTNGAVVSAAA